MLKRRIYYLLVQIRINYLLLNSHYCMIVIQQYFFRLFFCVQYPLTIILIIGFEALPKSYARFDSCIFIILFLKFSTLDCPLNKKNSHVRVAWKVTDLFFLTIDLLKRKILFLPSVQSTLKSNCFANCKYLPNSQSVHKHRLLQILLLLT